MTSKQDVLRGISAAILMAALSIGCSGTSANPTPTLFVFSTLPPLSGEPAITSTPVLGASPTSDPNLTAAAEITTAASDIPVTEPSPVNLNCIPDAEFDADVTIPDNTAIMPGAVFTKTWRLLNSGTCAWNADYKFVFAYGDFLTGITEFSLPDVPPGQTVDISVNMLAPSTLGSYTSTWRLIAPTGESFGTQPYVQILVSTSGYAGIQISNTPVPSNNNQQATSTTQATSRPGATARPSNTPRPTNTTRPGSTPVPPTPTVIAPTSVPLPTNPGGGNSSSYPGISGISYRSRQIWLAGKQRGNRPNVFSKVGDSITEEWYFLGPIGEGYVIYGDHEYLRPVINYYSTEIAWDRNSFSNTSLAAKGGWPAWAALDPGQANAACQGANPLDCEYKAVRPAAAFIMFGTNDVIQQYSASSFEGHLQRVVQKTIDNGVIPVLYTIPWCVCGDVLPFNDAIIRTARAYEIPLIDYYTIMDQWGINRGVRDDGIHPSVPPDGYVGNFDAEHLKYGYNIRNILTIQTLDLLWRQVLSY